jgi:chemotaxis protein methyltransferase CheR
LIADWRDWNITLLASDINPRFLRKAEAGVFGRWSFRGAPDWLLENYFRAVGNDQFQILPEIRQAVQFQQLNLVDDVYPSLANDTNAMDVIFCRNVLMYFTEPQAKKVLHNLYRAQMDGGWLIVSPSELMHVSATPYILRKFADAMVYQKDTSRPRQSEERTWAAPIVVDIPTAPPPLEPVAEAAVLYERGNYQDAAEKLDDVATESNKPASLSLLARALANQGKFAESLARCDQWVAADKLNPGAHYLRAVILQEQGSIEQAAAALRQTLYLDADFALAHFALANIARHRGHGEQAENHLKRALASLRLCRAEEPLPESDGITAGRFAEIISALLNDQPTV